MQPLYEKLQTSITLASLVLATWQIGVRFARTLVNQPLDERAKLPQQWGNCTQCGSRLESKGFVKRQHRLALGTTVWGQYLKTHQAHLQYRQFKKLGFPSGSGMVESACKWLIEQRFKGTGMRWSEPGFNHLLHLRLTWVNGRFDLLFADHSLTPTLYSPIR